MTPESIPIEIKWWMIFSVIFVGLYLFFVNYHSDEQRQLCATIADGWNIMKDREPTTFAQLELKSRLQRDAKNCDWFLEEMDK